MLHSAKWSTNIKHVHQKLSIMNTSCSSAALRHCYRAATTSITSEMLNDLLGPELPVSLTRLVCSNCSASSSMACECFCLISWIWASWVFASSSRVFFRTVTSCSLFDLQDSESSFRCQGENQTRCSYPQTVSLIQENTMVPLTLEAIKTVFQIRT